MSLQSKDKNGLPTVDPRDRLRIPTVSPPSVAPAQPVFIDRRVSTVCHLICLKRKKISESASKDEGEDGAAFCFGF